MGFRPPNYTQTPNIIFEEWLPKLKLVELRVLMVICRQTFGWHKSRDRISLSQLEKKTGSHRTDILKAIKELENLGLIQKQVIGENGTENTYYELVIIEDSNNSYQWESPTPPSGNFPPTKETTQNKEESPIVPKGDIPSSRKTVQEKKEELAVRVFITPKQHENLLSRANGNEKLVKAWYDKLSIWKIGKQVFGGKNDYGAICEWVIKSVENQPKDKEEIKADNVKKNMDLVKIIQKKCKDKIDKSEINIGYSYIEFVFGTRVENVLFHDNGFKEQVEGNLRKMRVNMLGFWED